MVSLDVLSNRLNDDARQFLDKAYDFTKLKEGQYELIFNVRILAGGLYGIGYPELVRKKNQGVKDDAS